MDEPQRLAEVSEKVWQATPPDLRQFIALLVAKLAVLEARFNQNSQNSSKTPSTDPPSPPPHRSKPRAANPSPSARSQGTLTSNVSLFPENFTCVAELYPTGCPSCQLPFPELLPTLGPPRRLQVWNLPIIVPEITEYQYFRVRCPCRKGWVTASLSF